MWTINFIIISMISSTVPVLLWFITLSRSTTRKILGSESQKDPTEEEKGGITI